jgi:hypothetical protein
MIEEMGFEVLRGTVDCLWIIELQGSSGERDKNPH